MSESKKSARSLESERYASFVFEILDRVAFKPELARMCNAMSDKEAIPGARAVVLAMGDISGYERYSDYLLDFIEQVARNEPALTYEEWLENGAPKKHDMKKEYTYFD